MELLIMFACVLAVLSKYAAILCDAFKLEKSDLSRAEHEKIELQQLYSR